VTSAIDLSTVYGSKPARLQMLRTLVNGTMKVNTGNTLPTMAQTTGQQSTDVLCGDDRCDEIPTLTAVHLAHLRQHNVITAALVAAFKKAGKPVPNDETLFQLARKIAIAEYQHSIYNALIPVIISSNATSKMGLTIAPGQQTTYIPARNLQTFNVFSGAAMRFGHSAVTNTNNLFPSGSYSLSNEFFDDQAIPKFGGLDPILQGMAFQPSQKVDRFIVQSLSNLLFQSGGVGTDLASINIQRGRDQGIPGYNQFRSSCGLAPITNMNTMPREFTSDVWNLFKVYKNPDDIDLFTGGISELRISGAAVGPTLACILSRQWQQTMVGDRYFFSHAGQAGSFTPAQQKAVQKRNYGDLLCEVSNSIKQLQQNVFLLPGTGNPQVPCSSRPKFDGTPFVV